MATFPIIGHEYPLILLGAAYGMGPALCNCYGVLAETFRKTPNGSQLQAEKGSLYEQALATLVVANERRRRGQLLGFLCFWMYLWVWIFGAVHV